MSQNDMKTLFRIVFLAMIVAGLTACSKPQRGTRAQIKTPTSLNPANTSQATQQAAALNANFTLATISLPNDTGSGQTVNVELQMPSGQILPLTTRHEGGNLISDGVYSDAQSGSQVRIQASCSRDNCFKYLILVTVFKNNQAVFQTFGISYRDDCTFSVAAASSSVGQFLSDIYVAENQYSNVGPLNDINSCSTGY